MSLNVRRYAEFSKVEDQDDGTIKVWGYASSDAVDSDGEVITPEAMKAAIPDYMKFGAIREMHQPIAAGTALEMEVQEDGKTAICAHVVDPTAIKKVRTNVYKGFSIGGKVIDRDKVNKTHITVLKLVETSLVDRPSNPDAVFTCYKADGIEDESDGVQKSAVEELGTLVNEKKITPAELLEIAKAELVRKSAPPVEAPAKPSSDDLKKGISSMCQFASILQALTWLTSDVAYEAAYEGDGSQIPAQLREWLKAGVTIFAGMSAEEVAELVASLQPVEVTTITASASTDDLNKAGARFSTATKGALKAAHDACKAADKALADLGYDKDDDKEEGGAKAAQPDDVTKAEQTTPAAVTPAPEPVQKAELGDLLKSELGKLANSLDDISKRLKVVEAQPVPPKGATRAVVVGKTEDLGGDLDAKQVEPVKKADGAVDEVATLIKAVHASGGRPVRF
jgi:hypothetical protein